MATIQGLDRSRLGRRTFLTGLLGTAGAALASGSHAPAVPSALAVPPSIPPTVRAQAGGGPCVLLPADFAEIRAKIADPGWARDAFNALKRSADGLVRSTPSSGRTAACSTS